MTTGRFEDMAEAQPEASEEAGYIAPETAPPSRLRFAALITGAVPWLKAQLERQADRELQWTAVAFGGGCGLYFCLKAEPAAWLVFVPTAFALVAALAARRLAPAPIALLAVFVAALAGGVAVSKLRTQQVAAPIAPRDLGVVTLEGWVVDIAGASQRGQKVIIAPVWIDRLKAGQTPIRVRMVLEGQAPEPGSPIRLRGLLDPPPPPSGPGAHDFPRDFYFRGLGGVGLALGPWRRPDLEPPPWRLRLSMAINRARWRLAERIAETVGKDEAGPAVAMTTGYDAWLDEDQRAAMRDAGLAHLLAIGGLHMGIVSGFAFFLTRLLIAAWPWVALRVNGKKAAAAVGLLTVGIYLLMSGAAPSAERAATTASTAFVAVLLNRRAITFNALAMAAILILLLRPESIVGASFQMSFAATMALVALAEAWPRRIAEINAPWPILAVQRGWSYVVAAMAASLVAGLATAPFSIYHFNATANYGVLANGLEFPLSTFVTMPALALGALFSQFGLGKPFLMLADLGLQWTLAIGRWVSSLPYATTVVPSPPTMALPVSFLGVCFVCLVRGPLRWLALPVAAAVFLWPKLPTPDVWVAPDGSNLAVREGARYVLLRPEVKLFDAQLWSQRRGLGPPPPGDPKGFDCDRSACKGHAASGVVISGWWRKRPPPDERLTGLCGGADLVVLRAPIGRLPSACAMTLVLDGTDFASGGALELWRRDGGWAGQWSSNFTGDRPWSRTPALR